MKRILIILLLIQPIFNLHSEAQVRKELQHGKRKPNIIFIIVDDQGYGDLGVLFQNQRAKSGNKPYESSPNLDRMGAEGAILTQHYAAAPVCAPSRASLLLGVSQGHANVRDHQFDKAIENNYTLPLVLRKIGYSTCAIGKWGLPGNDKWDKNGSEWPARPRNRGFDYFFGYMAHKDGHEHYPKEGLYSGKKKVWDNDVNIAPTLDKCYTADLWTAVAKKWITDHKRGKDSINPFFMYLAYDTPHAVDELPTQKYPNGGGITGGVQWVGSNGNMINTASGTPDSYIHPDYANATYDDDDNSATPEVAWPDTYKRYATANRRLDNAVGDLRKLLKDLHIDSNTVIIYTSDNGPSIETYLKKEKWEEKHLPTFFDSYGPFDGIKRDCWEGGLRMPTIAYWPAHIPAGKVVTTPGISYDWPPTFLDMAGVPAPERMDGVSLLPSLADKGSQRSSLIYVEYFNEDTTPVFKEFAAAHRGRVRNQMQLLRVGDYVGVRYDVKSSEDSFEIYDVLKDPQEQNNLAHRPQQKILLKGINQAHFNSAEISIDELQAYLKSRVLQIRRPDTLAPRPYDSTFVPALAEKVVNGIEWQVYKTGFPWIPQVETLKPAAVGYTNEVNTPLIEKFAKNNLILFDGYIKIPKDGEYTFYLASGGKAFLRVHDAQIIDEDFGYVRATEKNASILLKAGLHPFKLFYEPDNVGKPLLDFEWSGPGFTKEKISKDVFFRELLIKK